MKLKFTSSWYRQIDRVLLGYGKLQSLINQIAEVPELMLFHFLIQFDLNFQNLSKFLFLHFQKLMRFSIYKRCLQRQEVKKTREIVKKTCFRRKSDVVHSIFEQSLCSLHRKFAPFMVNLQIKKSHRLGQVRFLEMLVALFPISSKKGAFFQVS